LLVFRLKELAAMQNIGRQDFTILRASNAKYWKTGFYHIARQAQIPIVFAFLDYGRKAGGLGPIMNPTGDIEEDMITIRQFYSEITAKHPDNFGDIVLRARINYEGLPQ
jgi:1-acyl-sn-glycerol-3-phosphate acyltransferase